MILQVLPALGTGGVEKAVTDLVLSIRRHEPQLQQAVVSAGGHLEEELTAAGVTCLHLPADRRTPWHIITNAFKLAAMVRNLGVTLMHAHSRAPAWSVYIASSLTGIPWVSTFHGAYGVANKYKKAYNRVMLKADAVIAVSDYIAAYVRDNYNHGMEVANLHTITEGIDTHFYQPSAADLKNAHDLRIELTTNCALPCSGRVILLPARFTKIKGHMDALHAVALMPQPRPLLVFCGPGEDSPYARSLVRIAHGLKVPLAVLPSFADLRPAYAMADAVLNISVKPEAFGRTTAEALAMNRPVIGTDHGGTRDILGKVYPEGLIPVHNPGRLVQAINRVLMMSATATDNYAFHEAIHNLFSLERMSGRTLALYSTLTGK